MILTQYLNDVDYGSVGGQEAIGVGAASQVFFDKPVADLDIAQIALLAGLPQAPTDYNPFVYRAAARQRRAEVLTAMVQAGYITRAQANAANASSLQVKANDTYQTVQQPYVFDYVKEQLINRFGARVVDDGGLKIYTTIDLHDQALALTALRDHEAEPGDPAAALVSIDPYNGHILAMQNSIPYSASDQFNYAADAAAPDRLSVQGVRADDADQGLRRRPEPDLLQLPFPGAWMAPRLPDLRGAHR